MKRVMTPVERRLKKQRKDEIHRKFREAKNLAICYCAMKGFPVSEQLRTAALRPYMPEID